MAPVLLAVAGHDELDANAERNRQTLHAPMIPNHAPMIPNRPAVPGDGLVRRPQLRLPLADLTDFGPPLTLDL